MCCAEVTLACLEFVIWDQKRKKINKSSFYHIFIVGSIIKKVKKKMSGMFKSNI